MQTNIFWNFIKVFWKHRKFIVISCGVIFIGTFIVTSLMTKTYKASLTFVVLQEDTGLNLSSLLGDLPFGIAGFGSSQTDKFVAYLNSRRIRDVIIDEFDLWNEYGVDYIEKVYERLNENIDVIDNADGTISINCYFKGHPEKAAQMAQRIYDELYLLALDLNRQKASTFRKYIENNYYQTQNKLAELEDSMRVFQLQNNIIELESQTKFSFDALATLEAEKHRYRLQLDYLRQISTADNDQLKNLQLKYNIVEKNIAKLVSDGESYVLALKDLPNKALQYFRLLRDLKIQQKIMEILLPLYENAKMEEQKQSANLQLLDPPFKPQYKFAPKRLTYMIVITFLLFALEMFFFVIWDTYKRNEKEIKTWLNS